MFKLNTIRQNRQRKMFADVMNDSEKPLDTVHRFSICEGRPHPTQETPHQRIPLAWEGGQPPIDDLFSSEYPHGTKQSRKVLDASAHLSLEQHGWKHTGKKSSLWAFEHRWPHQRDHAEGRNHRLPTDLWGN